jgi:hypothetical protein
MYTYIYTHMHSICIYIHTLIIHNVQSITKCDYKISSGIMREGREGERRGGEGGEREGDDEMYT